MKVTKKTLEFLPGTDIKDAVNEAYMLLIDEKCEIEFNFNGIIITLKPERKKW
jgi:hypothetical protein